MAKLAPFVALLLIGFASAAVPTEPVLRKLDDARYQYVKDSRGENHLVDLWLSLGDLSEAARYDPGRANVYHLFTRDNPSVSQPLLINNEGLLQLTNFDNRRRTIVLIHGWRDSVVSDFNNVLVPAFLAAEDVNIIVVDWSAGAGTINYGTALINTIDSGNAVARFISWLNQAAFMSPVQYHIVGQGLGAHQAGIVGRRIGGGVAYITGLDPSLIGWINHSDRFQEDDAIYTEVIHTNAGVNGFLTNIGQVDFYPNGGEGMPGCDTHACDHARGVFYFAESLVSGGFTGRQCINYLSAVLGSCNLLPGRLQMGGLRPKIGQSGVFWLATNAFPPFSQG